MSKYAGLHWKKHQNSCRYREHKCCVCGRRVMTPRNSRDDTLCIGCAPNDREEERRTLLREKIRIQIAATRNY